MSLKNNPLSEDKELKDMWADDDCVGRTAVGTVTPLKYHDDISNRVIQIGMFLINSLWGGVKMVGFTLLLLCGGALVIGAFLGIPTYAMQSFIDGNYVVGFVMAVISLIMYGMGFNELR